MYRQERGLATTIVIASIAAFGSPAHANPGGASFEFGPSGAPPTPVHVGTVPTSTNASEGEPCPAPEAITNRDIAGKCRDFIQERLKESIISDETPRLRVSTVKRILGDKPINGELDAKTAAAILTGDVFNVTSPDPNAVKTELVVDLSRQILMYIGGTVTRKDGTVEKGGKVEHIVSISSGTEQQTIDKYGTRHDGHTSPGPWKLGPRGSSTTSVPLGSIPYGRLYRPRKGEYIHVGLVPEDGSRTSHGCIHMEMQPMLKLVHPLPEGTSIKIYRQLPSNNLSTNTLQTSNQNKL